MYEVLFGFGVGEKVVEAVKSAFVATKKFVDFVVFYVCLVIIKVFDYLK